MSLAGLLLNFLKEYHLQGKDDSVHQMMQDISQGGREPRALGRWGQVSKADVGEAVAAFNVWKSEGRVSMPAWYKSQTHKKPLLCYINRRNQDGTLDVYSQFSDGTEVHAPSSLVKRRADSQLVLPRHLVGWYVPSMYPVGYAGERRDAATVATGERRPSAGPDEAPLLAAPGSQEVWVIAHPFDGRGYGNDYLVLDKGDELRGVRKENGWAYGHVLRRQRLEAAVGPSAGWYPAEFAKLAES